MSDLDDAWSEVHAALPAVWTVGRPSEHPERQEWLLYAYDPRERPKAGVRKREWTAVAPIKLEVVRELARASG